jgi:RNA polymerase sigma-70 factor, ECF subfamily
MIEDDERSRRAKHMQAAAMESTAGPPGVPAAAGGRRLASVESLDLLGAFAGPPAAMPIAISAVFERHHAAVLRAAHRITGNLMDAEDVLQTVFTRLLRRPAGADALDLSQSIGSYLHRAAVNAALDLLRSRRRSRAVALGEVEEELADDGRPGPERHSSNRELGRSLRAALARLPPRQAEIFALRYLEGMGNKEIARQLGSSQAAIAVVLHRVRHRLRRELRPLQGEPS